jgi:hypothetical protein
MLAYISGSVDQELLRQNEYLVTETRVVAGGAEAHRGLLQQAVKDGGLGYAAASTTHTMPCPLTSRSWKAGWRLLPASTEECS